MFLPRRNLRRDAKVLLNQLSEALARKQCMEISFSNVSLLNDLCLVQNFLISWKVKFCVSCATTVEEILCQNSRSLSERNITVIWNKHVFQKLFTSRWIVFIWFPYVLGRSKTTCYTTSQVSWNGNRKLCLKTKILDQDHLTWIWHLLFRHTQIYLYVTMWKYCN